MKTISLIIIFLLTSSSTGAIYISDFEFDDNYGTSPDPGTFGLESVSVSGQDDCDEKPAVRSSRVIIDKFSNGKSFMDMNLTTFDQPTGLYKNSTEIILIPKNALILSATIDVEGKNTPIIDNIISTYNFNNVSITEAYSGVALNDPPTDPLAVLKSYYQFNSSFRTNISAVDALNVTNSTSGVGSYAYHLFQFNLSSDQFQAVNVTWVGHGAYFTVPAEYSSKLFYWNGTEFVLTGVRTGGGGSDYTVNSVIEDPKQLDSAGNLHILALSPAEGSGASDLYTNYIQVQTLKNGSGVSYPLNLSFDPDNDGLNDTTADGLLTGKITLNQGWKDGLQKVINSSGDGYGDVNVPLIITSELAGRLNLSNLQIVYTLDVHPELVLPIPNSTILEEDSGWTASGLDMVVYFHDGYGTQNLSFEVSYKQDASEVECIINSTGGHHYLDFYTASNFYGTSEFRVTVRNRGADGLVGNSDDRTTESNTFRVTVVPTNDAPEIYQLRFADEHWRNVNNDYVKLILSTERAEEDREYKLKVLATDQDGDGVNYSCNLTDGAGGDDLERMTFNQSSGELLFYPTVIDIGPIYFNLTTSDQNGTVPGSDYLNVELWVEEMNDVPVLNTTGPLLAYEDILNFFQMDYYDEEASVLIFRSNLTDGMGTDERDDFVIGRSTGLIEFSPGQEDVGTLLANISVEDSQGAGSFKHIQITVENVNDPPMLINVGGTAAVKNDYLLFDVNENSWLNLTVTYNDEDGDAVSFSAEPLGNTTELPDNFTIDQDSGTIHFLAGNVQHESFMRYLINFTTDDGNAEHGTDYVWLELQVLNVNDPPVISDDEITMNNSKITIDLTVDDTDGQSLRFIWNYGDGSPSVTTYGSGVGSHTYARPGTYNITVTVIDPFDAVDTYNYTLTLTDDDFPVPQEQPTGGSGKDDNKFWVNLGIAVLILNLAILSFIIFAIFVRRRAVQEEREKLGIDELVKFGTGIRSPGSEGAARKPGDITEGPKPPGMGHEGGGPPGASEPEEKSKGTVQTSLAKFGEIFSFKKDEGK